MGERHNITMEEGDCQETDPCCLAILDPRVGVIFKLYMCVFILELGIIHNIMKGVWVRRVSNSVIFIVASQINYGHFIKERICSHQGRFLPLRVDIILGRLHPPGKQTGSHEYCLPLTTWREKI